MRKFGGKKSNHEIEPDEILIDAANLPEFETERLEGRIERPLNALMYRRFTQVGLALGLIAILQLLNLQIIQQDTLIARAEDNRLTHTTVLAERA